MKRTALAIILVSVLSFSVVAGTLFVGLVNANPISVFYEYFPTTRDTSPLTVAVHSPTQNQTCNSTSVCLNFTVTKPESWLRLTDSKIDKYMLIGKITSAYYSLDGAEKQSVSGNYSKYIFEEGILNELSRSMDFSVNLSLPEGLHNVTVSAEGESYYLPGAPGEGHSTVKVYGISETVSFTVTDPPLPEPPTFPTEKVVVASGASAILIGAGLLVYFKRRKS